MDNMKRTRRKFSNEFKAKVALEALKERESLTQLDLRFSLHQNQISQWKREFLSNSSVVFDSSSSKTGQLEADTEKLFTKIGRLEMERDFLKKSLTKLGHMI